MATLSNTKIKDTYQSLVKFNDNGNITTSPKRLTDGFGNVSPFYVSTTQVGIGTSPNSSYDLHVYGNVKVGANLDVSGNLTVNGTLTYLNVTDLAVEDPLIKLAKDNDANTLDIGLFGKYAISTNVKYKGFFNDASDNKFKIFTGLTTEPTTTVDVSDSGYAVGTLVANLEGNVTGTVSSLSNHTTSDLAEGTNLYYTNARADARVNLQTGANLDLSSKDTDNLSEGTTNLYFTTTRARASFTAGTGVTITDGEIAIGQDVATDSNVNFNRITSSEDIRFDGTSSRFRSDTSFDFLFINGNAQSLKTLGVAAQTTYSGNSASSGMFNALNGYAVGTGSGTTVIDSSRNLTNIGTGNFSGQVTIPETPTADAHAASKKYVDDATGNVDVAKRLEVTVKNVSGGSLAKGVVVHAAPTATPPSGNVIEVVAADANVAASMPAIGVLNEAIADEAEGEAVMFGAVSGIDTSSFTAGDELYVSSTAGQFTATKPTATTEQVQKIAVVIKSHASNGSIKVFGAGRSNDVPNLLTRDITIDGADFYFGNADQIRMGDSLGLRIQHNGSNSFIDSEIGNLYLRAEANDSSISLQADDGSGGNAEYFKIDGTDQRIYVNKLMRLGDDVQLRLGDNNDLRLYHNSTSGNNNIENHTGSLYITNYTDDEDIVFRNDNGSGDVVEYFRLDGSTNTIPFGRSPHIVDNLKLYFGNDTANDASIKWDSTASQLFIDGNSKFLDVLYAQSHIIQSSSSSKFINGAYLEIGTGKSNTAQFTFNADYDGGETDTYTPNYSGSSSAGMSIIKMSSGGVGGLDFYVKNHGTTSGSHALSTFTKILELNQSGNSTFAGTIASNNIAITNSGNGELSVTRTSGATIKNIAQAARGQIGTTSNHELQLITNATSRLTISTAGKATFASDVQIGGDTIFDGYAQVYGFLYTRNSLRVLNAAGNGWHYWATRGGGKYDLNVNNITSAAINATTVGVTNIVTNKIVKFNGTVLDDSNITDDGSTVSVAGNLSVSGDVSVTGKDIVYKGTNIDRGSVVFEITEFDSTNSLRDKLNNETAGITRVDDSTAPDGGCWQMANIYRAFTIEKLIKVHPGQEYIFETWIKFVSGTDTDQRLYMGASFYDENKSYLGNSYRYWGESALQVDANSRNDGWYHTAGTLGPNQANGTGSIPTAARWMKLIMLVNYSNNANTIRLCGTRCYHSGGIGKQMITSLYRKKIGSTAGSNAGDWVGTEVIDSSGNFYINSSSTNTSFTGDTSSNLTIANSGNINFRANGSSINSMIITSNLIDINERVDIDPPSAGAALTLGRWTGQPNIKANTDDGGYMMMDSNGGWGAINWYSTDNVALALGGGRVLIGAGTTNLDTAYRMTINGGLKIGDTGNITPEADTQLAIRNNADGFIRMVRSSVRTWDHKIDSGGHYKIRNADGSYDVLSLTDDNNVGIGVGSPTHNLQIGSGNTVNSFNVGGNYGKTDWTRSYVVSNTNILPILDHNGNALPNGGAYRVTGHIDGTGTDQSSMAVFWNQNGTWFCNVTAQSGTTSNHIQFLVSGGVPSVKTYHANNYTVRAYHERIILNESTTDNTRHYFGSDSFMQMIINEIYLNYETQLAYRIKHIGDTDTFFGFPNNNQFEVKTAGNHNIFCDATQTILYQAGGIKLRTISTGVKVTGEIQLTDANTKLLEGTSNSVRVQTNNGYVDIGPMNSSFSHFLTDRPQFYFNKQITIDGHCIPYTSLTKNLGNTSRLWNIIYSRYFESNSTQSRTKIRVWSGTTYGIGMQTGYTFGAINNDYVMSFQMSNTHNRGFWWGDTGHSNAQGAMSLSTQGKLTVAHSIRLGYGESDTTVPGATYRLDVSGKIRATDDILAYSDARVKTNVKTIDNALEKVTKLRGVSYNRIDSEDTSNKIGVIAQEVKEVLPEIVTKDNEGMYSVAYSKMAGVFIEAIKDLKAEINVLKEEIKELKSK